MMGELNAELHDFPRSDEEDEAKGH